MLPDLGDLRCFEAAARLLSFRAAAAAVALSAAALGERVRRLEEQIGAPLFARTTRRVALTSAGEALLPQARRTLEEARRCLGVLHGDRAPYELIVGTRFELGLSWLTPSLTRMGRAHPERTLHLQFADSPELLDAIRRGTIDGAVSSVRLSGGDLEYEPLHEEQYRFAASPALLEKRPLLGPADAREHVLLDVRHDLPLFRYLRDVRPLGEKWSFRKIELLGTISAVRYRALEGAGVAVLPHYFIRPDLAARRLRPLLPKVALQRDFFRLIWRTGHPRAPELRELASELRRIRLR